MSFFFFFFFSLQILLRLSKLCVQEGLSGRKSRKQQQRLLRNMGAHAVVLELLQIPYEKVTFGKRTGAPLKGSLASIKQLCSSSREKTCACKTS